MTRLDVRRTAKLYIGGGFPRSESGRSYPVHGTDGSFRANVARASRKDFRDAVVAARSAQPSWAKATAYNRGQILYRVAEHMEGRAEQFAREIAQHDELTLDAAYDAVGHAIDRWVWFAGWSDKLGQVAGGLNQVAGPYFNISAPEPVGVVVSIAPITPSLTGLIERIAGAIVSGNTVIALASETNPLPAVTLAETLAVSDIPGGVVNILTGFRDELLPVMAAHLDVDVIDLTALGDTNIVEIEQAAAENLKRVLHPHDASAADEGPARILALCETKTVWHPKGP